MASNSTIPPDAILNPYTPLAFLPPDVAEQYQVVCYVYVATFAVSSNTVSSRICSDPHMLAGLRMGLAYVNSGGVRSRSESGIQSA
jgi:hypothetical protein